jgi:hypothetical protein
MIEPIIKTDGYYYQTHFKGFLVYPFEPVYVGMNITPDDLFFIDCMKNFTQFFNYQTIIFSDTTLKNVEKDCKSLMQTITNIKNGHYVMRLKDFTVLVSKSNLHLMAVEFKYNVYQAGFCHTLSKDLHLVVDEDGDKVFNVSKGLFLANNTDFKDMFTLKCLLIITQAR